MNRFLATLLAVLLAGPALAQTRAEIDETVPEAAASVGTIGARLSSRPDDKDATMRLPVVEILDAGKVVLTLGDDQSIADHPIAAARFAEMDPGNDTIEVVVTSYSGGAHCCTTVQVATKTASGWKAVNMGSFDGSGDYVEDADGDGQLELVTVDNAFLYDFDCYACSFGPLQIHAVVNGEIKDVTRDPRFLERHKSWLEEMRKDAEDPETQNSAGFLVGEVAMRLLVGEGAAAVKDFEKRATAAKLDPVDSCPDGAAECPDDQRKKVPFVQAVELFLKANGYGF
jgi:hypothetical protein